MIYRYQYQGKIFEINLERDAAGYRAVINGEVYHFQVLEDNPGQLTLRFQERPVRVYWASSAETRWLSLDGCSYRLDKPALPSGRSSAGVGTTGQVHSPMPAQVRQVFVEAGDVVIPGQTLLLLEAMKMEIRLAAPAAGTVNAVHVETGQTITRDQLLVEIHSET